jgi:hypothetical protein
MASFGAHRMGGIIFGAHRIFYTYSISRIIANRTQSARHDIDIVPIQCRYKTSFELQPEQTSPVWPLSLTERMVRPFQILITNYSNYGI